jgi:hypothetical protein
MSACASLRFVAESGLVAPAMQYPTATLEVLGPDGVIYPFPIQ